MNFLDILATNLGIALDGLDTDEKKMAAITTKLNEMRQQASVGSALLAKLNAKNLEDATATLATMVSREEHTKLQNEKASADLSLVLLEGQMSGKLTQADCDPEKGWAYAAAKTAPGILRGMLSSLPPKVATGDAIKNIVAGLKVVQHEDGETKKASTITSDGKTFKLTDLTNGYGEKELANLQDMIRRFGVQAMVEQGYITEG